MDYSPSNYTTTIQTCLYFCTTPKNQSTGYCPNSCLPICPSICHFSLSLLISSPHTKSPHQNLSPLLISMLTLLASTFLLITLYVLYIKLYKQTPQTTPRPVFFTTGIDSLDQESSPAVIFHPAWCIPTVGLSHGLISTIEVRKFGNGEELGGAVECTVCLGEFEEEEELRVLPKCNHAFHVSCIDMWLKSHTNCPLCRGTVVAHDRHDRTVEDSVTLSLTVSSAAGDSTLPEVRINIGEIVITNDKESEYSSSSRSERGAASLLSRSFSCGVNS